MGNAEAARKFIEAFLGDATGNDREANLNRITDAALRSGNEEHLAAILSIRQSDLSAITSGLSDLEARVNELRTELQAAEEEFDLRRQATAPLQDRYNAAKQAYESVAGNLTTYSIEEACAELGTGYNPSLITKMVNAGHFQRIGDRITETSLLQHMEFMNEKRFLDDLDESYYSRIAEVANRQGHTKLTAADVKTQIFRGACQKIGHGSTPYNSPVYIVTKSDDEIIEMLKNGRWMTMREIKDAGSDKTEAGISFALTNKRESFSTSRDGKSAIGYITERNFRQVGLENIAQIGLLIHSTLPSNASPKISPAQNSHAANESVKYSLGGRDLVIHRNSTYSIDFVYEILKRLHSGAFQSQQTVENVVRAVSEDTSLTGIQLIDLVEQLKGMRLLDSGTTRHSLENEVEADYRRIEPVLKNSDCVEMIHGVPGTHIQYIRQNEMPLLVARIRVHLHGTNDPNDSKIVRQEYRSALEAAVGQLSDAVYTNLLVGGIINEGSAAQIRSTYERLIRVVGDYRLINTLELSEVLATTPTAIVRPLRELEAKGIVIDVGAKVGGAEVGASLQQVYAVKVGCESTFYNFLGRGDIVKSHPGLR